MTVSELIDALWALDEAHDTSQVFIWVDGERYPLSDIDATMDSHIDLNAKVN